MYYTGKGDGGTTTLFGSKDRISKQDPVFAALGSIDELNSWLGLCSVKAFEDSDAEINKHIFSILKSLQEKLFIIQAQLAGAEKEIRLEQVTELETTINAIAEILIPRKSFVVPGGSELSAMLDVGRTLARRTERFVLAANPSDALKAFLNRLSSVMYILARRVNDLKHITETGPSY
jgi:cob(I)alamin adenosyltransferase